MSWSTELFCSITFNKETFNSKNEVINNIEETERRLQIAKDRLRDLVIMTEPNKFCPENYDPILWINNEQVDAIDTIEDCSVELYKLRTLLNSWDECHDENGLAINPPDDFTWKTAFLDGDFVNSVKYPNCNSVI